MKLVISISLATLMMFASCSEAPKDVISRTENESVTESLERKAESDLVFDTVENVTKNAASVLENKYQNIVLPDSIEILVTDKAYTLSASRFDDNVDVTEQVKKLTKVVCGEEPLSLHAYGVDPPERFLNTLKRAGEDVDEFLKRWSEENDGADFYEGFKDQKPLVDEKRCMIAEDPEKYRVEYWSSGTFSVENYGEMGTDLNAQSSSYAYDVRKDDLNVSYSVGGKDYSLADALSFAEEYVNEKLMPFLVNDDLVRADKIYVSESKDAQGQTLGYYYTVTFLHIIDGIPISDCGEGQMTSPHMVGTQFYITIALPDRAGLIGNGMYFAVLEKKPVEKLITLSSALAKAEKTLAPYGVYNIKRVSLEYCAREEAVSANAVQEDTFYEYHPMWCLTVTEEEQMENGAPSQRTVLYIDAVSGNIYLWNGKTATLEIDIND